MEIAYTVMERWGGIGMGWLNEKGEEGGGWEMVEEQLKLRDILGITQKPTTVEVCQRFSHKQMTAYEGENME